MAAAAGGPKGLILGPLDRFIFGQWLPQSSQTVHLVGASIGAWRMASACLNDPVAAFERLERVVFSSGPGAGLPDLPFVAHDYPTQQVALTEANFQAALQASCSIPFVLQAVHDIADAPAGAYWDGGVTDYHLHLDYAGVQNALDSRATQAYSISATEQNHIKDARASDHTAGLVLYPHFQRSVVPGWLDKHLSWRHGSTPFLDTMVLLAPNPDWVKTLPNGKLPDRGDFMHYGADLIARMNAWNAAVSACHQLADEFAAWLEQPDLSKVKLL